MSHFNVDVRRHLFISNDEPQMMTKCTRDMNMLLWQRFVNCRIKKKTATFRLPFFFPSPFVATTSIQFVKEMWSSFHLSALRKRLEYTFFFYSFDPKKRIIITSIYYMRCAYAYLYTYSKRYLRKRWILHSYTLFVSFVRRIHARVRVSHTRYNTILQ